MKNLLKKIFFALMVFLLPLNVSAKSQNVTIDGDHGKLAAVLQTPDGLEKFPLVIICHGFNADKDYPLLKFLADDLETRGIASIRFDFNGHGQSDGEFQAMTIPNEIADAKCVFDYVRRLPNVTNIGVTGHSQGGVVTSMLAGELGAKKIRAIVLFAPSAILRDNVLRGELFHIKFDVFNPPEYIEISTPYGNRKVGREYIVTLQKLPIYETAEKFTGPALMIHGTGDTRVPYTNSQIYKKFFRRGKVKLRDRDNHAFTGDEQATEKIAAEFFARQLKK